MLVILCAGYHRSFTQVENRIPVFKTVFPYSIKKWVYSIQEDPCSIWKTIFEKEVHRIRALSISGWSL